MEAISFLLTLIKIFFQVILVIILLILLILLAIIFSNINLKVTGNNKDISSAENLSNGEGESDESKKNLLFNLKLSYLFGIIKFNFDNTNNTQVLKIFGLKADKLISMFDKKDTSKKNSEKNSKKKKDKNSKKKKDKKNSKKNSKKKKKNTNNNDNCDNCDVLNLEDTEHIGINQEVINNNIDDNIDDNTTTGNYNSDDLYSNTNTSFFKKIINNKFFKTIKSNFISLQVILDKIKQIFNYPDKDEIIKAVSDAIKSLFSSVTFKKIDINLEYSLGEPYETGVLSGIISAVLPIISDTHYETINLIPDYDSDDKLFNGEFNIECKTNIFRLGKPIVKLIINSPIRKLIGSKAGKVSKKK